MIYNGTHTVTLDGHELPPREFMDAQHGAEYRFKALLGALAEGDSLTITISAGYQPRPAAESIGAAQIDEFVRGGIQAATWPPEHLYGAPFGPDHNNGR